MRFFITSADARSTSDCNGPAMRVHDCGEFCVQSPFGPRDRLRQLASAQQRMGEPPLTHANGTPQPPVFALTATAILAVAACLKTICCCPQLHLAGANVGQIDGANRDLRG